MATTNSRPVSLHHAIANGDITTVQSLLKQGVDADSRLHIDDDILETASRKSISSIISYRSIIDTKSIRESIMEINEEITEGEESVFSTEETERNTTDNKEETPPQFTAYEEVSVEIKIPSTEEDDIEAIMKQCQDETVEEEEELEVTVIEVEQDAINTEKNDIEEIQEDRIEEGLNGIKNSADEIIEVSDNNENSKTKNTSFNNNRKSLADCIDEKLNDANESLFERHASVRIKEQMYMTTEEAGSANEDKPLKLLPRLKRKISLKWKKPKKDLIEDDEDEDFTYENIIKAPNVDDEQLNENFEGVAFFEAVREGMDMIVQTLLETSNNYQLNMLDENGFTPIMQAAWHGQTECLQILLEHGAQTTLRNATGCTASHFAAGQGHTECLKLLITYDVDDIDVKTKFGATPLILAAKGGHTECLEALLNSDADPNIQYRGNQNALLFAAGNGHYECIQALLAHNVQVDQPNSQNVTSLMRAVQQGHNTCVALLSDNGADINLQDAIGRTAVHFAVEHNNPKGLKLLLQKGANLELKTKGGSKALNYAERFQNTKCGEILENHINKLKEEREKEKEIEVVKQIQQEKTKNVSCMSFKHIFRRKKRNVENV